jgi:hypothetical protein
MKPYLIRTSAIILSIYAVIPLLLHHNDVVTLMGFLAPEYMAAQIPILNSHSIWNYSHRISGPLLLLIFLLQSKGFSSYHRILGYVYVILAMIMSIGGVCMVLTSPFNPNETLPTVIFALLLLIFTLCGITSIKSGGLKNHIKWMNRSFAIALGPLTVRIVYMILSLFMSEYEAMTPSFWIGWGLPLILMEVFGEKRK